MSGGVAAGGTSFARRPGRKCAGSAKRPNARRGSQPRGFTLVEVLVALVIVTLGMAALMSSLSSAADGAAYMRDKTFAQWVALDQIALARLQAQAPSVGDKTGEMELANRKWTWKQTVTNTDAPGIARIDVSVRPSDVPPPNGDKDAGWFVTVSGIRGNDVAIGTGTPAYHDITQVCESWGQLNQAKPYSSPPRVDCRQPGGGVANPGGGTSGGSNSGGSGGSSSGGSGSSSTQGPGSQPGSTSEPQ